MVIPPLALIGGIVITTVVALFLMGVVLQTFVDRAEDRINKEFSRKIPHTGPGHLEAFQPEMSKEK